MNEDLKGSSLADVLEKLEKGKIGHRAAMEWLNVESYDALVEIMHVNGRLMPGHQPMRVAPETRELVRRIFRPVRWARTKLTRKTAVSAMPASAPTGSRSTPSSRNNGRSIPKTGRLQEGFCLAAGGGGAPIPAVRATTIDRIESTHSRRSA
jgi:hypothetical protein